MNYENIAKIAANELDAEAEAQLLYDEYISSRNGITTLQEISTLFPDYNTDETSASKATDHILKDMELVFGERFTETEWATMEERLAEKIHAGLT
jgi:hypothetical protein